MKLRRKSKKRFGFGAHSDILSEDNLEIYEDYAGALALMALSYPEFRRLDTSDVEKIGDSVFLINYIEGLRKLRKYMFNDYKLLWKRYYFYKATEDQGEKMSTENKILDAYREILDYNIMIIHAIGVYTQKFKKFKIPANKERELIKYDIFFQNENRNRLPYIGMTGFDFVNQVINSTHKKIIFVDIYKDYSDYLPKDAQIDYTISLRNMLRNFSGDYSLQNDLEQDVQELGEQLDINLVCPIALTLAMFPGKSAVQRNDISIRIITLLMCAATNKDVYGYIKSIKDENEKRTMEYSQIIYLLEQVISNYTKNSHMAVFIDTMSATTTSTPLALCLSEFSKGTFVITPAARVDAAPEVASITPYMYVLRDKYSYDYLFNDSSRVGHYLKFRDPTLGLDFEFGAQHTTQSQQEYTRQLFPPSGVMYKFFPIIKNCFNYDYTNPYLEPYILQTLAHTEAINHTGVMDKTSIYDYLHNLASTRDVYEREQLFYFLKKELTDYVKGLTVNKYVQIEIKIPEKHAISISSDKAQIINGFKNRNVGGPRASFVYISNTGNAFTGMRIAMDTMELISLGITLENLTDLSSVIKDGKYIDYSTLNNPYANFGKRRLTKSVDCDISYLKSL
jgi:hypothetical protein